VKNPSNIARLWLMLSSVIWRIQSIPWFAACIVRSVACSEMFAVGPFAIASSPSLLLDLVFHPI